MPSRPPSSAGSTGSAALDALLEDEENPTLASLQAARLAELKAAAAPVSVPAAAPGHGVPAPMSEAEAISATAAAGTSLLLFSHGDMATCAAMEAHLADIARRHAATACVVVQAEDCQWLAGKLGIRVLPAVLGFVDGKEVGRVVGFEGIAGGKKANAKAVEGVIKGWGMWKGEPVESESESEGELEERTVKGKTIKDAKRRPGNEDEDSDWD